MATAINELDNNLTITLQKMINYFVILCHGFIKFLSRTLCKNLYTEIIKEEQKMFMTYQKKFQTQYLARTWQSTLRQREIEKNSYRAMGDVKKAKAFVIMVRNFKAQTFQTNFGAIREHIIFSSESLAVPLLPAYVSARLQKLNL